MPSDILGTERWRCCNICIGLFDSSLASTSSQGLVDYIVDILTCLRGTRRRISVSRLFSTTSLQKSVWSSCLRHSLCTDNV